MKRARVMFKFKELLDRHADELAREISSEHGKVHDDALGEVARGIDVVDFACGIPHLLKGEFSRNVGPNHRFLFRPPAARRRRRHHAVQLPRHGADVDVSRSPSPAATPSSSSPRSAIRPPMCSPGSC
jgi:hypothetical protein